MYVILFFNKRFVFMMYNCQRFYTFASGFKGTLQRVITSKNNRSIVKQWKS